LETNEPREHKNRFQINLVGDKSADE